MSKSKGNVIDPLDLMDEFGADALRFTLAAMAAQGRDIKLAKARVEGYRNFGTKLWNAARFAEINGVKRDPNYDPVAARVTVNRWIAGEAARTRDTVTKAIEDHRYNEAAGALYQFVWNVFCDWYVELIKPILGGTDDAAKTETQASAAWVLDQILLLLHPFMPFVTEELWQQTATRDQWLMEASWPSYKGLGDAKADAEIQWVISIISEIRSVRAEMNISGGLKIPCVLVGAGRESRRIASAWENEILRLAGLRPSRSKTVCRRPRRRSCWAKPPLRCRSKASSISPPKPRGWQKSRTASKKNWPQSQDDWATPALWPRPQKMCWWRRGNGKRSLMCRR